MKDPRSMENLPYEELKTVVLQFPYASNLRMLLLQKSLISNIEEYERDLHLAATYSKDRDHLFRRLKETRKAMKEEDAFFFENSQSTKQASNGSPTGEKSSDPEIMHEQESADIPDPDGERFIEELLDYDDIPAAAAALESLENEGLFTLPSVRSDRSDEDEVEASPDISSDTKTETEVEGKNEEVSEMDAEPVADEDSEDPFMTWLRAQMPTGEVMPEEDRLPISGKSKKKNKKKKKKQQAVIEKAAQSLLEKDEVVSETLARILEEQEQYAKAIEMYERLSLIFPEKSHFFADRIKQLKKK